MFPLLLLRLLRPTGRQKAAYLMEIYGPHCGVAAGCMVLLSMMQRERAKRLDIYYVFAIGSESDKVSQRGVKCAKHPRSTGGVCR